MPSANFASDQAQVLVRAAKKVHTCAVGEHVVPARRSLMVGCPLLPLLCAVVQAFILAAEVRAETVVYESRFDAKPGAKYPEWSSTAIAYSSRFTPPGSGSLAAQRITNTESPKHNQRFLGEFGGPRIDPTARTRVIQTLKLSLDKLAPHKTVTVSFDLLVLKSWDGNSPQYGPDRFRLKVVGGPILLDTTFSNNPKTATDRSFQDYP
ncbi:MAG TPA: hypothetical protein VGY54_06790, partial [Polyangiaceae bacterium]|nr:hypothetical protein [Polyangiaceae bacterium]